MKKLLMVKYAPEIFLKGLNKGTFERKLKKNIENVLVDDKYELITDSGRWFIYSEDLEKVVKKVKKVFGIAEVCIVSQIERDFNTICEEALRQITESGCKSFKVETNRANKGFPGTCQEISSKVGAYILGNNKDIHVDVHNPECVLNVEIREYAYVYSKRIKAVGGMPYETNGSTLLLLSGGIDSPAAGYLMARRGSKIFVPKHPKTKPMLNIIKNSESKLDVEKLINDSVEKVEIIDI